MADPSFSIVTLPNGENSVMDSRYGEIFHPVIGPGAEARLLYVDQLRLGERCRLVHPEPLVVWDVGLGMAANACAVLEMARGMENRVHLVSFDGSADPIRFAVDHAGALPHLQPWMEAAGELLSHGRADVATSRGGVRWELILEDFPSWLAREKSPPLLAPHAILFDPCSPARNPEMWTASLFRHLHAALAPDRSCALATYSRATHVRVGLLLAGFYVGRGRAAGAKEETTVAANQLELIEYPLDRKWLTRIENSSSAEPLTTALYRQAPLSEESWARLRSHPQFVRAASFWHSRQP